MVDRAGIGLDLAQQQIERAAILRPAGPGVALEAGVIAVLAGRDEAALLKSKLELDLMRQIKTALDPQNLFNPNKVLST